MFFFYSLPGKLVSIYVALLWQRLEFNLHYQSHVRDSVKGILDLTILSLGFESLGKQVS